MNHLRSLNKQENPQFHHRFRELAEAYQRYSKAGGIDVKPYAHEDLPHFSLKSPEEQRQIIEALEVNVRICQQAEAHGDLRGDSPALVWQALKEFGFRPPSDVFTHISKESIVEIHSPTGMQLFRNFNFYKYCSYTLEELYCGTWASLYERDLAFEASIMELSQRIYGGEIKSAVSYGLPVYMLQETSSEAKLEIRLEMQWVAPLFREKSSQAAATIAIESATLLKSTRPQVRGLMQQKVSLHSVEPGNQQSPA